MQRLRENILIPLGCSASHRNRSWILNYLTPILQSLGSLGEDPLAHHLNIMAHWCVEHAR